MRRSPCRLALGIAAVVAGLCVGCAGTGMLDASTPGAGSVRTPAGESLTPQAAMQRLAPGKSTQADVLAALGPATVIPFDSGWQVWVYRWPGREKTARAATELVVLFEPSGLVSKARIRPGYD